MRQARFWTWVASVLMNAAWWASTQAVVAERRYEADAPARLFR